LVAAEVALYMRAGHLSSLVPETLTRASVPSAAARQMERGATLARFGFITPAAARTMPRLELFHD
jgi:hypothetical protein